MILTHFLALRVAAPSTVPELAARRGGTAVGFYPLKSPSSVRDAAVLWTLEEGETISSSIWAALPAEAGGLAVVPGSAAMDGLVTACRVEGGIFRRVYQLVNTITTSRGQVLQETLTYRIGLVEMAT